MFAGPENESAGHQRMQPEPFPNHKITGTGRESKSRSHFFRSLLDFPHENHDNETPDATCCGELASSKVTVALTN